MHRIQIWEVRVIGDCEGRSMTTSATFTNYEAAHEFSESDQGRDMYGHVGDVCKRELALCETAEEAGALSREKIREGALQKLSASERAALGV